MGLEYPLSFGLRGWGKPDATQGPSSADRMDAVGSRALQDDGRSMAGLRITLKTLIARIVRNRRGNVAMIFGFALMPLLVAVGSAIDYSQAARSRNHIATSADAAALAATKAAQTYMTANGTGPASFAAASLLAQTAMTQTFAANQTSDGYSQNVTAVLVMTQDPTGIPIATVTTTANAPTFFMRLVGIPVVAVGAVSQAKGAGGTYYQIVFVIDVSNSMAVGGTAQDITNLQNDRYIQNTSISNGQVSSTPCAFPCHDPNAVVKYASTDYCANSPGDYFCHAYGLAYCPYGPGNCANVMSGTFSDKRAFAKKFGYKLKIDYVRDALNTFVTQLTPYMTQSPQYFNVAIDTFGTGFAQVQSGTNDPTILQNTAGTIDVETAALSPAGSLNQGWTYTTTGLNSAFQNATNIGDGSSPTKRLTYFIFMSDSVEDIYNNPGYIYNRKTTLDYVAACQAIQAAGAQMFSIEAAYPVIPGDIQYNTLVTNLPNRYVPQKTISQAMQQCASSSSQYFYASDGPGIQTAVQQVFSNIFSGSLHLTR